MLENVDQMDRFQVATQLNRLFVYKVPRDEIQQMRLQLKKVLLEEILKVDIANQTYIDRLEEIITLLQQKPKGYS